MIRRSTNLFSALAVCTVMVACGSDSTPSQGTDVSPTTSSVSPDDTNDTVNADTTDADVSDDTNDNTDVAPAGSSNDVDPTPPVKPPELASCEAAEVGSPVLRMLTGYEFQNTINDIFPALVGKWSSSLPSNTVAETGFDND